ncbi:hypothetical protein OE88DRAFT_1658846 [Heliocybe sulcata]|uniref:Uncharacterized protein n=1 Tax=Heliocybe sulcata TaxID=5364 RepID=A0A5C3N484_9AGAM|nr:hypothetical protein OE88DRAFT_1658846 [Heliocybe sulcata]
MAGYQAILTGCSPSAVCDPRLIETSARAAAGEEKYTRCGRAKEKRIVRSTER